MKLWCITLLCLATLNITACDYASSTPKTLEKPPFARSDSPPPIGEIRDVAQPANTADGLSVDPIVGLSANNKISGPIGLTTDRLFNAPVASEDERFSRLEGAVQKLSDTVNQMSPSVKRLMEVDADLDNLMYQLETLVSQRDTMSPAQPLAATTSPSQPTVFTDSGGSSGGTIRELRVADHAGKTRLVFETSQKPNVTTSLSNADKTVSIFIDHGASSLDTARLAKRSALIAGMSVQPQNGGTLITLNLTRSSAKMGQGYLPPNRDNPNHRVYVDLRR